LIGRVTPAPLLVVRHVPWEGPHRILDAFEKRPVQVVDSLDTDRPLPAASDVGGAVFMGGPMSANDVDRYPRLGEEIEWLREAVAAELPVLGVCLGSQLLARALGAAVRPGPAKEIGFAPIEVLDASDPLLAPLAPAAEVLHWHGEVFELPVGAVALARSALTDIQAFRAGPCAWGLLFHAEADDDLVERWLDEPAMADEARAALGDDYARLLRAGAKRVERDRGQRAFAAFAAAMAGHG
jgi:GMP synthase (glutamine-hydrolysing)